MKRAIPGALGAVALAGAGFAFVLAEGEARIPHDDPVRVAAGAELYQTHCAACHGVNLEGEEDWRIAKPNGRLPAPPHDETGHTWHHPDALLVEITRRGTAAVVGGGYQSDMPGFGDVLSDGEILSVLAYIKSTWPPRVIAVHDRINAEAGR